jgi:hypothetical protein
MSHHVPVSHLDLEDRKVISARTICSSVVEVSARAAASPEDKGFVETIRAQTRSSTHPPGAGSLSDSVDSVLKTLVAVAGVSSQNKRLTVAKPVRGELKRRIGELKCSNCSPIVPCRGFIEDDQIVAEKGECLKDFKNQFAFAHEVVVHHYNHYRRELGRDVSTIPVTFNTEKVGQRPHDLPSEILVSGRTKYHDSPSYGSQVFLILVPTSFDWNAYCASLYLLFHELFVHAFQSTHGEGLRTGPREDDPFSEGWMDWLAFDLMSERIGAQRGLPWRSTSQDDNIEGGRKLHDARTDVSLPFRQGSALPVGKVASTYAQGRSRGRRIAKDLLEAFYDVSSNSADLSERQALKAAFHELSVGLNLLPDVERRAKFTDKVGPLLVCYGSATRAGLIAALRLFVEHRNINKLIDHVVLGFSYDAKLKI